MFTRVLVANRGEIACRVIRALYWLGIRSIAVHSEADARARHVSMADESHCIGPAPAAQSYLDVDRIIDAARRSGAEAIHPGYGYLSEQASFAEACEACHLAFIGPTSTAIEQMGHKARARALARSARVPVIPGSDGTVANETEAARVAARIGLPVYIKAVAGGGGTGIRRVDDADELPRALQMARSEAESAFGNPEVYVEKLIEEPRHIEAQVLADAHGHAVHLGLRECSVQNPRHKKLVEEAPASEIPAGLASRIAEAAVRLARAVSYRNAGTVEFLVDRRDQFYFLEMNTRLQVEHPVTECITGIDVVQEQIRIAAGEPLAVGQKEIRFLGHAIECRLTAEDPRRRYAPSAGRVEAMRFPGGPGVRVDSHVFPGYDVPPYYDPMLAKLVVWAPTRAQAIARMARCLGETEITGLATNLELHVRIMANPFYRRGDVSTDFLARHILNNGD